MLIYYTKISNRMKNECSRNVKFCYYYFQMIVQLPCIGNSCDYPHTSVKIPKSVAEAKTIDKHFINLFSIF